MFDPKNRSTYVRVYKPKFASCLFFCQTFLNEIFNDLPSNTNTGTTCTEENSTVVLDRSTASFHGVDESTNNDSTSALNIIIEARVDILVPFESWEWVLKILKLDDDTVTMLVRASRGT